MSSHSKLSFPRAYEKLKLRNLLETNDIFYVAYETIFYHHLVDIHDEHARTGPAVLLFDGIFLSQFKRYQHEIVTQCGYWLKKKVIKF